ncbi:MAG: sulfite oxidase-like oxidoreductase [Anaerolineae bacterium]|nr:sulfite oxidase-like oxidoreductase [Anaerolineae bacterium]MCO5187564.1 sulfite oxidase-like oxidoreductase [Anaerolineae bacterium]MCO5195859.1 sulfite oxidase-like oxidoreductase [Anaerolineae bacterium]MCO5198528.1 sulfite oxidase-like oxidoreductase [Anaerolineae bacterium]MCO5203895.1 sulfite oxidase-like oxidoreductase [Anaerolineae bacterium]
MLNRVFGRKDEENQVRSENRLPPGQSLTRKFPVLHYGPVPRTDLSTWTLRIFGAVAEEVTWNWEQFNQLPRTDVTMDIHCVTRWSKFDTQWQGVSLKTLIDQGFIKPLPSAKYVIQHCEYGFTTNLPLDFMLEDNVLLATHFDGKPLTPDHGYPLRVVVGSFADRSEAKSTYFWKGGKWLRGLEFRADDQLGFWEKAGYNNNADPWREERFSYR